MSVGPGIGPGMHVNRLSAADIDALADHILDGRLYSHNIIPIEHWTSVFPGLLQFATQWPNAVAFRDFMTDKVLYAIQGCHEQVLDANYRGWPIFTEFCISFIDDFNAAVHLAIADVARRGVKQIEFHAGSGARIIP